VSLHGFWPGYCLRRFSLWGVFPERVPRVHPVRQVARESDLQAVHLVSNGAEGAVAMPSALPTIPVTADAATITAPPRRHVQGASAAAGLVLKGAWVDVSITVLLSATHRIAGVAETLVLSAKAASAACAGSSSTRFAISALVQDHIIAIADASRYSGPWALLSFVHASSLRRGVGADSGVECCAFNPAIASRSKATDGSAFKVRQL
jgi:hypothetical protein